MIRKSLNVFYLFFMGSIAGIVLALNASRWFGYYIGVGFVIPAWVLLGVAIMICNLVLYYFES